MTWLARLLGICAIAGCVVGGVPATASAGTFFVNQRGAPGTCAGSGLFACPTIKEAVARAEASPPPNVIQVEGEPGEDVYKESVSLTSPNDGGLTIVGAPAEPGEAVEIEGVAAPALNVHLPGAVTLTDLTVTLPLGGGAHPAVLDRGTPLTLVNDVVNNEASGGTNGIDAEELAAVDVQGGKVITGFGLEGRTILASDSSLTVSGGATIFSEGGSNAGGILSRQSTLSVTGSSVIVEGGSEERSGSKPKKTAL